MFTRHDTAYGYPDHCLVERRRRRNTDLPLDTFPESCPWSLAQLQALDFSPEFVAEDTEEP